MLSQMEEFLSLWLNNSTYYICVYIFTTHVLCIYLFLAVLGLFCCASFSLVVASWADLHGSVQTSHCSGCSCCRAQALGRTGFSNWGSQALEHWLSSPDTWA